VTEHEQAKAALAALADRKREEPADRRTESESAREQGGLDYGGDVSDGPFEWGADGTAGQTSPGQDDVAVEYRRVIERAVAATDDIEAAAAFVESVGLDGLERAVERAEREVSGLAADGREALATFERYRTAAEGSIEE